jgi:outer membrane protein
MSLVMCLLAAPSPAAQSLADIYALARSSDPKFAAAGYVRDATRESLTQAWSQLRPTLSFLYQYTDTSQDIISSDNTVFDSGTSDFSTTEYTLRITQPVFELPLILNIGQARVEQSKADLELLSAEQDLIVRVSERYVKALAAQDQLVYARAEEAAVKQHHELAKARFEMGLAPVTDLYDARARLASREARTLEAEIQMEDAFQAIRELTGVVPDELVPMPEKVILFGPTPDDAQAWVDNAIRQNTAVMAQSRLVEIARREVQKQRAGHYPTLDLVGRFNNQNTEGTLFGGGSEVETVDISLQLNIPLYQGGVISSRVSQASSQYSKVKADLDRLTRESVRLARTSFLGVKSSIRRIDALDQTLTAQQSALDAKQEGYRSGLFTSLAVLDAERDLYMAKTDFAQARYDYILNNLRLRQAVGSLSEQDLIWTNDLFVQF